MVCPDHIFDSGKGVKNEENEDEPYRSGVDA